MIILERAEYIPIGATVKPIGIGTKHCTLINDVSIVGDNKTYENKNQPDCLFLLPKDGDVTSLKAITPNTRLEWVASDIEVVELLRKFLKESTPSDYSIELDAEIKRWNEQKKKQRQRK